MNPRVRHRLPSLILAGFVLASFACSRPQPPGAAASPESTTTELTVRPAGGAQERKVVPESGLVELAPEANARAGIEIGTVETEALGGELESTGQVGFNEDRLAHAGTRIPGRIVAIKVSLGARVRRGQTLAVVDSLELGQAKAAYLQARAREELTSEVYERENRLAAEKISSEQEALTARAAHLEASAELRRADETLRLLGMTAREVQGLRQAEPTSSLSPISSPFDGTVVEKSASLGEMVQPEQKLFTVADLGTVWLWVDVFEKDLRRVHPGDGATVAVDAYPGEVFQGKVSLLAETVDAATRTARARVIVENRDGRLRPGMFARIRLFDPHSRPEGPGVAVVPESAVQRQGDGYVAFVPEGARRYRLREVRIGRKAGDRVEVLSGLKAGEKVVVKGTFLLASEAAKSTLGEGEE